MRLLPVAAACLFAAPAFAGTITETYAFSGSPEIDGTETINGAQFDPMLGTLTGVSLTASGTYKPSIFVGPPVTTTAAVQNVELIADGSPGFHQITDGDYTLFQSGTYLTGLAQTFSETISITASLALKNAWVGLFPNEIVGLASVDVFDLPSPKGAWGSMADDVSQFSGDLTITYSYTPIQEPSALTLFTAAALLPLLRRRRA